MIRFHALWCCLMTLFISTPTLADTPAPGFDDVKRLGFRKLWATSPLG